MNFLFKYKKIFLGLAILIAAAIFGYLIYFLFFYEEPPRQPREERPATTTRGELPEAGEGEPGQVEEPGEGIPPGEERPSEEEPGPEVDEEARGGVTETTALNDEPSMGATLSEDGKGVQYYNQEDGKFYKIDENGNVATMTDKVFHDVDEVTWSPTKNKAVLEYPDGSNIVYNFDQEKQVTLPKHWEDFDFSPNGNQIVSKSIGLDEENRWLITSDADGGNVRAVEEIGNNADSVYPNWSPNHQMIAMHTEGVDFDTQKVFFTGKNNENFENIKVEGRNFQPKWSEKGDKLLYSVYSSRNDMKPQLWSVNANPGEVGTKRQTIGVNTWAEKCTFANNHEAYCGVPKDLPEGAGMFEELGQNTSDQIYKIDIEKGDKQLMATPDKDINVSEIQVSEDGSTLFFTDSENKNVHKMKLGK